MKLRSHIFTILFLLGFSIQLSAQQTEADRKLLAEIRANAKKGDAQSQYSLGDAFLNGKLGLAKDEVEAVKWFRKAADQNYALAQSCLGSCFVVGRGVAKEPAEAVKWFRKAAEQNDALGQFGLGACYWEGAGVAKDEIEAVKWLRKAAEHNIASAQFSLGFSYENGKGVAKDEAEAVKWYRKAAEQENAAAQCNLGSCYLDGQGVAKDEVEAVKWYRKAADQNEVTAESQLGMCYFYGHGVAKDYVEAVKWVRKAAEQNYALAQAFVGAAYADGQGVPKDEVEAVKWYRKAAEQNNAAAQCTLGSCYLNGRGVAKNEVEAVKWYRKAAEHNEAVAQNVLGVCYHDGIGVAKDYVEAVKWVRKAAEQNNALAQYGLGVFYGDGQGVAKDYVEAYKWMLLAAGQGHEGAKELAASLESLMTKEQIAEGQKLARNFKPREAPPASGDNLRPGIMQTCPESSGTGFFITEDGFLITNEHVVKDCTQVRLVTSAGLIAAKVVKVDAANDLALLKAGGRFTSLPITSSRTVKLGGTVATVGFPNIGLQGFSPKLAKGEIASLSGAADDARYFQISVPVQPGNSGGALVDERGNVVGVVAAKLNAVAALDATGALPENVNYAVKSSFLLSFLESVPDVASKLKEPYVKEEKFEDVVKSAQDAAVLVLVY